jgi:hypothetical protein
MGHARGVFVSLAERLITIEGGFIIGPSRLRSESDMLANKLVVAAGGPKANRLSGGVLKLPSQMLQLTD